ncbi:MAG: SRPBCC family protein [Candidatus Acidiferrales bacterium]
MNSGNTMRRLNVAAGAAAHRTEMPQRRATKRLPYLPGRANLQPGGCLIMDHRIEKRIELQAPVSRVWRALTDHREFGEWFRVKLDGPFVPGQISRGHMTYPGYEHVKWEAVVQKMDPERLFSFTWHPYSVDPKIDYSQEAPTLVEFRLEKTTSGTLLLLTESGFDKVPSDRRVEAFRMNDGGWTQQMKNIETYVAPRS